VTVLELVQALNLVLGTNSVPTHAPARAGDVRFSLARIERITQELGYKPEVSFEEGLRRTIEWYRML